MYKTQADFNCITLQESKTDSFVSKWQC